MFRPANCQTEQSKTVWPDLLRCSWSECRANGGREGAPFLRDARGRGGRLHFPSISSFFSKSVVFSLCCLISTSMSDKPVAIATDLRLRSARVFEPTFVTLGCETETSSCCLYLWFKVKPWLCYVSWLFGWWLCWRSKRLLTGWCMPVQLLWSRLGLQI